MSVSSPQVGNEAHVGANLGIFILKKLPDHNPPSLQR